MAQKLTYKIDSGTHVRLKEYPTNATGGLEKSEAAEQLAPLVEELNDLQYLMWGAQTHALLVVIQGRDAAGKDGLINTVFSGINPQGLAITSFKVPTPAEVAHDFLWRVHAAAPGKGMIGIYNRSHYEEVLVVRVHKLASDAHIESAYDLINDYERLLTATNTIVVKLYLHLSKDEQRERLLAREKDPSKAWKLNPNDWAERSLWDDYTAAYEDALSRCSPDHAPWYVIPADRKWAIHLGVAQVVAATLRPYRNAWLAKLTTLQQKMLAELATVQKD